MFNYIACSLLSFLGVRTLCVDPTNGVAYVAPCYGITSHRRTIVFSLLHSLGKIAQGRGPTRITSALRATTATVFALAMGFCYGISLSQHIYETFQGLSPLYSTQRLCLPSMFDFIARLFVFWDVLTSRFWRRPWYVRFRTHGIVTVCGVFAGRFSQILSFVHHCRKNRQYPGGRPTPPTRAQINFTVA